MQMPDTKFVLTYWNLRSITQVVRNLLEYLELPYDDNTIQFSKQTLEDMVVVLDNPRIPSLKHGELEIVEILPMCKYLCRVAKRTDLLGKSLRDEAVVEAFIVKLLRVRRQSVQSAKACASCSFQEFPAQHWARMKYTQLVFAPQKLKNLSNSEWYMGYLTLVDFFLYEQFFYGQGFCPVAFSDPLFESHLRKFESLEQIDKYIKSGRCCHQLTPMPALKSMWRGIRKYK